MNIHATCVKIDRAGRIFGAPRDAGILLMGKSGAGKSDIALRLLTMGAKLVADDRTELFMQKEQLFGRAPKTIAGLMEVRGVGVIKFPTATKTRIVLAITLTNEQKMERLPPRRYYKPDIPEACEVPLLPLFAGISAPEKILVAVAGFSRGLFRD